MSKSKKIKNTSRSILQGIIVVLLAYMVIRIWVDPNYIADFEAYCPFGGLQAFTSFLVSNSLACTMNESQIFMGIGLFVGVLLFSKLFCSFLCPIGTFTEWLAGVGSKFRKLITLKGASDKYLRVLKYGLLFVTLYFTVGSSELFCKEYDPFYAAFTGFGHDVYLWFALAAIILTVVGSFFIRQFWCKYVCPLGAISNIFSNGIMFAVVLLIYFILLYAGLEISWIWPAAIISILGFVLESWRMEGWIFPLAKITRNVDTCTDCKICDEACPMAIEISAVETVKHIDCHLCGDCLSACPVNNTMQINKRSMRWLPVSATVVLVAIGLYLATVVELPTINIKWAEEQQIASASIFSQSGLKSIKCYGSSMSFANKVKRIKGILGVETFVKSHTVKVYYDTTQLHPEAIQKAIFTPAKTMLRKPGKDLEKLVAVDFGIDKLFDSFDNFYLTQLLAQTGGIYGFSTKFGEPVPAKIYFDPAQTSPEKIIKAIEQPSLTYKSQGKETTVDLKFGCHILNDSTTDLSAMEFVHTMFSAYNQAFNSYKKYEPDDIQIYQVAMPQATNPRMRRNMTYLVSHISSNDNIVRFETIYTDRPYARIYFVKGTVQPDSIYEALQKEMYTVHYRNGKTGQVKNTFRFPTPGSIVD